MIRFIITLFLAASLACPASAATQLTDKVYLTISPDELIAVFGEMGFTFAVDKTFDSGDVGLSGSIGQQPVRMLMSGCKSGGCSVINIFGLADPAGITLKMLNDFNGNSASGRAALIPDGPVIVAHDDVVLGVSKVHLAADIVVFEGVIKHYFKAMSEGGQEGGHTSSLAVPGAAGFADSIGATELMPELQATPEIRAWVRATPFMTP